MPVPRGRDDHQIEIASLGQRLVVVGTLGVELGRLLAGLYHQLAGVLRLLRHHVANGNHLRVLCQEPTEQAGASSAHADESDARILGRSERHVDHRLALAGMHCIRERAVVELERGGSHGAKLQELAPAGLD